MNEQEEIEQNMQIKQRASHGPRRPPAKDVTVTANRRPPLKRRDVRAGNGETRGAGQGQEQDRQQIQSVSWRWSGLDRGGSVVSLPREGRGWGLGTFREPC